MSGNTGQDINASTGHNPESTYDVFQQAQSTSQHDSRASTKSSGSAEVTVTKEIVRLLNIYQTGIGTWMDILDHSCTYQRQVLRYALSSSLLLHAICALSAKQMSLIGDSFLWESVSTRYYGLSLGLLIEELKKQQSSREIVIAATILLCSYELLACPGADYQKHLYGARSLFHTHNIASTGTKLEKASFWIYARQDVSMALVHECATLVLPQEWPTLSESEELEEDVLGNQILWILAKLIQFKFSDKGNSLHDWHADLQKLISEIDLWWERFPIPARGVATTEPPDNGLKKIWFSTACLYYHLAKILSLECLLERPAVTPPSPEYHTTWLEEIGYHAITIASISLSPGLPGGALVVTVNPLFYGKHDSTVN
ncbi:hypothetical protein EIK77_001966 [Talaromyces pinophilus]|nr:hypothetical protein EIK77_001966 [Talaromyces pinophilus]